MALNPRSQMSIDQFNEQLRANPEYRAFLQSIGANPNGPLRLSDRQRKQAAAWVKSRFGGVGNLEIDPAGNLNQNEGFGKQLKRYGIPAGQIALGVLTGGMSLPAQLALNAGVGAGIGAFDDGVKGALKGAGIGAASAYGGHMLRGGSEAARGAFDAAPNIASREGMRNAATLTALGGDALGIPVGTAAVAAPPGMVPLGGVTPRNQSPQERGARGGADGLLDNLLSPESLTTAGSMIAALMAGGDGMNDQTRATEEQARRLQAITEARMRRVDPLHEAVTQLAFSRLPISSRNGIPLPRVALPTE